MLLLQPILLLPFSTLGAVSATISQTSNTASCYGTSLPHIAPSTERRSVPWGTPSVHFSSLNGTLTTCCDTLDEVRTALDAIDSQILDLLNQRAAYVREATRFKSTRASVNVPSRNRAVVEQAEQQAIRVGMPVTIALAAFGAILNSSVPFEQCIFDTHGHDDEEEQDISSPNLLPR